jgi:DOPA 4,5-dioxygenase
MYQVAFAGDQFAAVVPWLMLNRGGLSILVHPVTDDPVADHEVNPLWLGEALAIDVEFIRGAVKQEPPPSRVGRADVCHI